MKKLQKINIGDTLGLIDASSIVKSEAELDKFIKLLNDKGYKVKEGKSLRMKDGYLAGSDEMRAQDVMDMFLDDEVKGILCYKGGYGAQRILPYLDFDKIAKHPKLLMGFSDVTILLNTINKFCDFPTIHGEMGVCLSTYDDFTIEDFFRVISDGFPKPLKNVKSDLLVINEGEATGRIVGGNLSLIYALMGTKYEIEFKDNILFIEDVDEAPYSVDRMLSSLVLSGKLDRVKGIICGYFTKCEGPKNEQDVDSLLIHYLKRYNVPMVMHFESGHDKPFVNLPIGMKCKLDTKTKSVIVFDSLYQDK